MDTREKYLLHQRISSIYICKYLKSCICLEIHISCNCNYYPLVYENPKLERKTVSYYRQTVSCKRLLWCDFSNMEICSSTGPCDGYDDDYDDGYDDDDDDDGDDDGDDDNDGDDDD